MSGCRLILMGIAGACVSGAALANGATQTTTDTFVDAVNIGRWSFFGDPDNSNEIINMAGGNPGAWLSTTCEGLNCLDTFAPNLRTEMGVDSVFTGDYRSREVERVGVDVRIDYVDFSADERPLTLILYSDNGTDVDQTDDFGVFLRSDAFIPVVGEGWRSFDYDVPSGSATLPAGWGVLAQGPNSPSGDEAWNTAIQDVKQVGFFFGDPDFAYIFQQWQCGTDNPRVTEGVPCPADINGCGSVDSQDLAILLGDWGEIDSPADINKDGEVNSKDLDELLGAWGPCI